MNSRWRGKSNSSSRQLLQGTWCLWLIILWLCPLFGGFATARLGVFSHETSVYTTEELRWECVLFFLLISCNWHKTCLSWPCGIYYHRRSATASLCIGIFAATRVFTSSFPTIHRATKDVTCTSSKDVYTQKQFTLNTRREFQRLLLHFQRGNIHLLYILTNSMLSDNEMLGPTTKVTYLKQRNRKKCLLVYIISFFFQNIFFLLRMTCFVNKYKL